MGNFASVKFCIFELVFESFSKQNPEKFNTNFNFTEQWQKFFRPTFVPIKHFQQM